ncbi:hypothetical protein [Novosphingobium sp.]|uniref:hypothetical protein n=1 Tax=Novosphingobium sp. TaxID=1874826 RepID=UPI0027331FEC|nr:hypothetical protein [Novosphingobium sp.]MDP3906798.1 hypothetical protein [Novosphingobium sp.]
MLKLLAASTLLLSAACAVNAAGPAQPKLSKSAQRGLAFAEQRCAACHAVTVNTPSPNPESPAFEDIANTPGLTRETLRTFLRDSHNFPDAMNFKVPPRRNRDLADYMVTLQRPDYRPAI